MKFLIDNNLSPALATLLGADGYDSIHVRDLHLSAAEDEEIFLVAESQNRVIVSADTDFGFILSQWKKTLPPVLLLRYMPPDPRIQADLLLKVITRYEKEIIEGHLFVIEPDRVRIKKLPF